MILPPLETNLDPNPIPSTLGLAGGLAKKAKQLSGQNHVFPHCLTLLSVQKKASFVGMIWRILNPIGPHSVGTFEVTTRPPHLTAELNNMSGLAE